MPSRRTLREDYWDKIYEWYAEGGDRHVAAFLASIDISGFDPKAPPPKTAAFWSIVNANRTGEESELQDVLDKLGNPIAVTLDEIRSAVTDYELTKWLDERRNRKAVSHRLENCGYSAAHNPDVADGRWRFFDGSKRTVYVRRGLSFRDQVKAVRDLQARKEAEAAARKAEAAAKAAKGGPGSRPISFYPGNKIGQKGQ